MDCTEGQFLDSLNSIHQELEIILHKDHHNKKDINHIKLLLCNILNKNNKFASNVIFSLLQKITNISPLHLKCISDELIHGFSIIVTHFYHKTFSLEIACI
jgi:hypothetical protein